MIEATTTPTKEVANCPALSLLLSFATIPLCLPIVISELAERRSNNSAFTFPFAKCNNPAWVYECVVCVKIL